MNSAKPTLTATIHRESQSDKKYPLVGRLAWTIFQLVQAGRKGCTPVNQPAPRWSDYVFQLRNMGFKIETITEKHTGAFAGQHGRYVLRDIVTIEGSAVKEWSSQEALRGGAPKPSPIKGVAA